MNIFSYLIIAIFIVIGFWVRSVLLPPRDFPNIPVIPFYVSFLTLFNKKLSQEDIYNIYIREKLERNGAVALYFASRWNIILQHPDYLREMFRNIQVFEKSGNQKKVPYSVLADYTGDNIISSHGDLWKLYRKVLQPGLQKTFNQDVLVKNSRKIIELMLEDQRKDNSILVQQLLQRFTLANVGDLLLDSDFEVSFWNLFIYINF